jgi:hypothetical protein
VQLFAQEITVEVVYDKSYNDIKAVLDLSYNDNSLKKVIKKFDTEIFSKITKGKSSSTEHSFSDDKKTVDVQLVSNKGCSPCAFLDHQLKKLKEANKEYPLDDIKVLVVGDVDELSPIIGECDFMDKAKYIPKENNFFKQQLKQIKKSSRGENVGVIFFYPTDEAPDVELKVNRKKNILFLKNSDKELNIQISSTFKNSSRIGLLSIGDGGKERKFQFDDKGNYLTSVDPYALGNGEKICVSVQGCDEDFGDCIEIQKQECDPVPKCQESLFDETYFNSFQQKSQYTRFGVDYDLIGIKNKHYYFAVENVACVESYKIEIRYANQGLNSEPVQTLSMRKVSPKIMKELVDRSKLDKYQYLRINYKDLNKDIFNTSKNKNGFLIRILSIPYGGKENNYDCEDSNKVVRFNKCG